MAQPIMLVGEVLPAELISGDESLKTTANLSN